MTLHNQVRMFSYSFVVLLGLLLLAGNMGTYSAHADDTATTTATSVASLSDTSSVGGSTGSTEPQIVIATSTDGTGGQSSTGGTIVTGDAAASSTVDNHLNTNVSNPDGLGETNSSTVTSDNNNSGELGSSATSTAETGENSVIGEGSSLIVTGNAVSTANVINEVNTNIFNSDGLIIFLNQLFGVGIDLNDYDLSYFFAGGPGASPSVAVGTTTPQCTLLTCLNSSSLNVYNTNNATVTNSVIVRSSTGENIASSTGGAAIDTGDAYAAANVVNLVNTNIINSSYLLLSFNNFGDLLQNITLPGADFFSKLFAGGAATSSMNASTYTVQNDNTGTLSGTTTATAETGDNSASSTLAVASSTDSGGEISTGNAYASANTFNQLNSTNIGGTSVFMLFHVSGDWTGTVRGLPAGIKVSTSTVPGGSDQFIQLVSGDGVLAPAAANLLQEYNSSHFVSSTTNMASVDNNVAVSAHTGGNQASTATGTAAVETGNAYAVANVVNLVNTDIIGQNWIFAVFNIFGAFKGDIVFGGSPSFSVAVDSSPQNTATNADVTYTFTVTNTGHADADQAVLNASFDNTLLSFTSSAETSETTTGRSWRLGRIAKGETRTFSYSAHVGTNFPAGRSTTVPLTAVVVNDNITSPSTSNTANTSIIVTAPGDANPPSTNNSGGNPGRFIPPALSADPKITVTKQFSFGTSTNTVDYRVVVVNATTAGPAYRGTLIDTLTDPAGNEMYTRSWNLDTIAPGDEIQLTYTVAFGTSTKAGIYHNSARVVGEKSFAGSGASELASAFSDVQFTPQGAVLGAASTTVETSVEEKVTESASAAICSPLISSYLKYGKGNNTADVFRLQQFLNARGEALPQTGFYGSLTTAAVKRFQVAFAAEILTPWGLSKPTGSVYRTTQSKINGLACGDLNSLTLDPVQIAQIAPPSAPTHIASAKTAVKPAPKQTKVKKAVTRAETITIGQTKLALPASKNTATAIVGEKNASNWLSGIARSIFGR